MTILSNLYKIFNSKILINISDKYKKRFKFGFECLSLKPLISLNANARTLLKNRKTAETKIYRVVHTKIFINYFLNILSTLNIVKNNDKIIIDFSTFNTRQVLMFAKQTENGRAIPLYFNIIKYPIKKDSQNIFIMNTINDFLKLINYKQVNFVMDRGFACPSIIKYLCKIKQNFIIRIKKIKYVKLKNGKNKKVKDLHFKDMSVYAYENNLRVVRSDNSKNWLESWYLVTNNFKLTERQLLKKYYYRFEIEELFKDNKHLHGLEYVKIKKIQSMKIVLYFVMLGIWFFNYLEKTFKEGQKQIKRIKKRGRELSYIYYWFERWLLETRQVCLNYLKL